MPTFRTGSTGPDVSKIQSELIRQGFLAGKPDRIYGPKTRSAVIVFQKKNGLTADGIAGPSTLRALLPGGHSMVTWEDLGTYSLGVDVSHYQEVVNWSKVASLGVNFAYIKATDGIGSPDKYYSGNIKSARSKGILAGSYHFFRALDTAQAQADHFCSKVDFKPGDLPPAVDLETTASKKHPIEDWSLLKPASARINSVQKFLDLVEKNLGVKPVLYTGVSFVKTYLGNSSQFGGYPLWIARYPLDRKQKTVNLSDLSKMTPPTSVPPGWNDWAIWQFTGQGSLPKASSVGSLFDLDVFRGSIQDLKKFIAG